MRIRFRVEGGFASVPALARPFTLDVEQLPAEEAAELRTLVEKARFFELPAEHGEPPRGAADYRRYEITIEEENRSHTVRRADPVKDPEMRALIRRLETERRAMGN